MARLGFIVSHPLTVPEKTFHNGLLMPPLFLEAPTPQQFLYRHIFALCLFLNAPTQQDGPM